MASSSAPYAAGGSEVSFNPYTMPPWQPNQEYRPPTYYLSSDGSTPQSSVPPVPGPGAPAFPLPAATPPYQDISGGMHGGTRPLNVRKESSVTFSNAAAANSDWNSSRVLRESPSVTEVSGGREGSDVATLQNSSSRRVLKGRRGMSIDNRSMYSVSSAVTSVADVQTAYVNMLMALDHIHWLYDVFAYAFCWLLLAGFIVMPQTLTKTIPDLVDKVNISDEELKNALKLVVSHVGL